MVNNNSVTQDTRPVSTAKADLRNNLRELVKKIMITARRHEHHASDAKLLCRAVQAVFKGISEGVFYFDDVDLKKSVNFLLRKAFHEIKTYPDVDQAINDFRLAFNEYILAAENPEPLEETGAWLISIFFKLHDAGLLRVSIINALFGEANNYHATLVAQN